MTKDMQHQCRFLGALCFLSLCYQRHLVPLPFINMQLSCPQLIQVRSKTEILHHYLFKPTAL